MPIVAKSVILKKNEALDPIDVTLLGAVIIVHPKQGKAELIELLWGFWVPDMLFHEMCNLYPAIRE